jgi:hypothetical protein
VGVVYSVLVVIYVQDEIVTGFVGGLFGQIYLGCHWYAVLNRYTR